MSILDDAARLTAGDRQQEAGHPYDNFRRTARLWMAYLEGKGSGSVHLTSEDVAYMMILFKIGRTFETPRKLDHLRDIAGYARCVEMVVEEEERRRELEETPRGGLR